MKKFFLILCFVFCLSSLFCWNVYSDADNETRYVLEYVDDLILAEQYETAFGIVSGEENEYILAKKIEIAVNYFAQSIMHKMFAFKDMDEGETLLSLRTSAGNFPLVMFNPVEAVEAFKAKKGDKAVLDYALGLFYYDVQSRYGDEWFIPKKELYENIIHYLQKAYAAGCYDSYSLSILAISYFSSEDYFSAASVFRLKEAEFELSPDDNYHCGLALWLSKNPEQALGYIAESIDGYADIPAYQCESYIIAARICLSIPDFNKAESFLIECKKKFPYDYRIPQYSISLYAMQNLNANAVEAAFELFSLAPENPAACQMIIEQGQASADLDFLPDFFEAAIKMYKDNSGACENLYFHYAYSLYLMGREDVARNVAFKAKEVFLKNGNLTSEVENMLDQLIE
ncbi:MAG: hypothetical protein K5930_04860 [Treponemataceae bacterium]|nr:hypothetical protein [Treponemataceae bacterium]